MSEVAICYWCEGPQDGVELPADAKPEWVLHDYEPCPHCAKEWEGCIAIAAVDTTPVFPNLPPVVPGLYLTGGMVLVSYDALEMALRAAAEQGMQDIEFHLEKARATGRLLMVRSVYDIVFPEPTYH